MLSAEWLFASQVLSFQRFVANPPMSPRNLGRRPAAASGPTAKNNLNDPDCPLGVQWQWHLTIKTGPFETVQNVNDSTSTCVPFVQTYSGLNIFTFTDACTGSVSATVTI